MPSSLVILTGAGISVESGLPSFRGSGGLWRTLRPEDVATPQAFAADPAHPGGKMTGADGSGALCGVGP